LRSENNLSLRASALDYKKKRKAAKKKRVAKEVRHEEALRKGCERGKRAAEGSAILFFDRGKHKVTCIPPHVSLSHV